MARLPTPGGDSGNWGAILNEYLSVSLDTDGIVKDNVITAAQLAPNAVDADSLGVSGATNGQILVVDSTASNGISWKTLSTSGGTSSLDQAFLTGVVIEQGGVYPARPTGYANVKFIGVNDPGSTAQDGDEWVKL